jgi:23S rRNA (guanosine2251-2'-O)-methyltransferase
MEILEGKQCILPALQVRQRKFQLLLIKQGTNPTRISEVIAAAEEQKVPFKYVSAGELDAMTKGRSHGGLAAICSAKPAFEISQLVKFCEALPEPAFLLLIEGTEDAQNLGYTLRSAEALGAHGVLLKKHVWNFDAVKVSRASSGAFERLPLVKIENAEKELLPLRRLGIKLWGCIGGAKRTLYDVDLTGPLMLAIGGERRGLSGALRQLCDGFVRIPMKPGATSLSLSHAASIVMAEVMRQRWQLQLAKAEAASKPADAKNFKIHLDSSF